MALILGENAPLDHLDKIILGLKRVKTCFAKEVMLNHHNLRIQEKLKNGILTAIEVLKEYERINAIDDPEKREAECKKITPAEDLDSLIQKYLSDLELEALNSA